MRQEQVGAAGETGAGGTGARETGAGGTVVNNDG
jgi:hypothetical protein